MKPQTSPIIWHPSQPDTTHTPASQTPPTPQPAKHHPPPSQPNTTHPPASQTPATPQPARHHPPPSQPDTSQREFEPFSGPVGSMELNRSSSVHSQGAMETKVTIGTVAATRKGSFTGQNLPISSLGASDTEKNLCPATHHCGTTNLKERSDRSQGGQVWHDEEDEVPKPWPGRSLAEGLFEASLPPPYLPTTGIHGIDTSVLLSDGPGVTSGCSGKVSHHGVRSWRGSEELIKPCSCLEGTPTLTETPTTARVPPQSPYCRVPPQSPYCRVPPQRHRAPTAGYPTETLGPYCMVPPQRHRAPTAGYPHRDTEPLLQGTPTETQSPYCRVPPQRHRAPTAGYPHRDTGPLLQGTPTETQSPYFR
ncbi:unnamed protein product [Arctogadus glacialis]